ncbi:MAG: hypothetical protein K2P84_03635 [Undibacterium sp.]|nr:hypothetical protein [Undibacterium sp.]
MSSHAVKILTSTCLATFFSALSIPVFAGNDLNKLSTLQQAEFNRLAKDLTSVASYKANSPATPLGLTGFDVAAELAVSQLSDSNVWKKAGADVSTLVLPKLHIHKGLPKNFDIGASISMLPNSSMKLLGVEARYALFEGGIGTPAVGLRAAYSQLSGASQLDFNSKSVEIVASKGFAMFTPYIGAGQVWGSAQAHVLGLQKTTPTAGKIFAGLNANFGLMNLAGELDKTGENQTLSVKLGFRW